MQVKIGEKIKELRKRDGRKQEDLAKALGVTAQAVSRWESNGCYPDMGMLPAIANFFHVSIDSLFGYNNDREEKIKELTTRFNRYFIENDPGKADFNDLIQELRSSLKEFPGESELLRLLALALAIKGEREIKKPNPYLEEAASILEGLPEGHYPSIIFPLLNVYTAMGDTDKAERKAAGQPSIQACRELLLASLCYGEKERPFDGIKEQRYKGEAILTLLHETEVLVSGAVSRNEVLYQSKEGLDILEALRVLYTKIFAKKDFGKFHSDLCMLNLGCARVAARTGDFESACQYLDSALEHYTEHEKFLSDIRKNAYTEDSFQSGLIKEVGETSISVVICRPEFITDVFQAFPEDIQREWLKVDSAAAILDLTTG